MSRKLVGGPVRVRGSIDEVCVLDRLPVALNRLVKG